MPSLTILGLERFDSDDKWSVRGNGTSVLPLTGGYTVQITYYAGQPFRHMQVVDEGGTILGWFPAPLELTDEEFRIHARIVERQLAMGRGPLELAQYFNDIREMRVFLDAAGDPLPPRSRFQVIEAL